ncbi:MAG: hypothetical protein ACRELY_05455, partial [Polyangiaceae bacterium]
RGGAPVIAQPMQVRVVLRDRSLLDVIDLALRFVAEHWSFYARAMLVVIFPAYALTLWIGMTDGWAMAWLVSLMLAAFAQAPFTILASKLVFEHGASVRAALGASLRLLPRLAVARFTQAVALIVSSVMCLVPVFYTGPAVLFLPEVALLEGIGIGTALTRAQRLAFANAGDAMLVWITLACVSLVSVFLFGDTISRLILENLFEVTAPESVFSAGGSYTALLGFWLAIPILATMRFFFYLNTRTQIEGWDIQARFLALTLRAREAA